ncbi:PQ-loop-domain-containing protein [Aureobasidium sp. EXF-3400]|nr:PQ-loop-domain-containing protein [Aureobasidium sp. EXF-12344]KAI4779558.1 PQ-loop-domain-containing protein [Aureobasidium sp. EXF-3400]
MFPPSAGYNLDIEAISGIMGSISIACWVVVFSPQIIENFRRSSAEGLSIEFVIIWLLGDFANIIGAVMQRVLPTMIILAIYYTFADIVLLAQCFYYRGFHFRDPKPVKPSDVEQETPTERSGLLSANGNGTSDLPRVRSASSFGERFVNEGVHMSPANPMHPTPKVQRPRSAKRSIMQKLLFNLTCIVLVVAAGIAGYYLSPSSNGNETEQQQNDNLHFNIVGQVFGYLCAALYLGSRIPQLLLNYRRKSTEGLNALFFLFACIGNLTYVLSIFAFNPICHHGKHGQKCRPGEASEIYGRYILVNLSWLLGSLGTLFLDFGVFAQFFIYRNMDDDEEDFEIVIEEEDRGRSVQ